MTRARSKAKAGDLCNPAEHTAGHIPDAVNAELDSLRQRHSDLADGALVMDCPVVQRAPTAVMLLQSQGDDVANLVGGYRT